MAKDKGKNKEEEEKSEEKPEEKEGAEGDASAEGGGGKKKGLPLMVLVLAGVVILLIGGGAAAYFMGFLDGLLGIKAEEQAAAEGEHAAGEEGAAPGEAGEEGHEAAPAEESHGGGEEKAAEAGGGGGHGGGGEANSAYIEIPKMVVNLNTEDGVPRYLSLSIQLELKNPGERGALEAVMPRVIDQFQTYLRELRAQDLRGSAGIYRLQTELLWRVNEAAAPVVVKDVLFQEILIQ